MVMEEKRLKSPVMEPCISESIHWSDSESPLPEGSSTARLMPFPPSPVKYGSEGDTDAEFAMDETVSSRAEGADDVLANPNTMKTANDTTVKI
jgi:hypothetical protein